MMRYAMLFGAASACAIATSSLAQTPVETQTDDTEMTNEIVVTAQKREESLRDVPMSVTALTGAQLASKGITDVQGLMKVTPGFSFVESGSAVPVYSLRGVGFFDTAAGARPTVSVYQDQIPIPFSIETTGASFDLERVEVLKGPQGILFGQNATGGAINYIAAKPSADFGAGASVSYARFNTVDVSGYLTGPLGPTLNARLAVRGQRGDDYQYSYTRDDTHGAKRFLQGRFLLDWKPSSALSVELGVSGFRDRSDTQAGQLQQVLLQTPARASFVPLLIPYPTAPASNRAADFDAGEAFRRNNKYYQLSLRGDYYLNDMLTVTSITAYSDMSVHQRIDQDGTSLTASTSDVRANLSSFSQELRLAGDMGAVQFVVGGYLSHDKAREDNVYDLPYSTISRTLPTGHLPNFILSSDQNFKTAAVFGNVDIKIGEALTAHAGARYTNAKNAYSACNRAGSATTAATLTAFYNILRAGAGSAPIAPLATGDCVTLDATLTPVPLMDNLDQDNVSWRLGLDWKPAGEGLIYANVSRGYKAGSVSTPPALATAAFVPATQESVLAYEVGFKFPIKRRYLEASGALFYYDYSDKQVLGRVLTQPTQLGALQALVNVPQSRIQGAEFQINSNPVRGLSLMIGGTYLDSKVTRDFINYTITAVQTNFKGNAFPYTPKYQLVADAQYEMPIGNLIGMIGSNMNYRSTTNSGFGNLPSLNIDGYTLIDVRAAIRTEDRRWQAMLFVRNLTDKYYWTNVARLTDTIRRYAGEPRTYGVQLSTKF
ncbi:TonB-dependent receptor [Sphingobium boeckii]|uniref:Outer membrane receptor protein involved in Fe transport n=1 Tax=Sphingobium boeckii TaxID=1082345 RepID=A0A7W9EE59_9SPHN|nr:TonB-dependent receptor [Sphingobium boeckii]MBB5685669.1 outer membrane receptor protein involved in Fe transport [Sphingobium boeckii]